MPIDKEYVKMKFITGDYASLRDFAEKEGISYAYVQQLSAAGKWREEKSKRLKELAQQIEEKTRQDYVKRFEERKGETISIADKLKTRIDDMIAKTKSAKEVNALASALYRVNELECNILGEGNSSLCEGVTVKINLVDCHDEGDEE